MFDIGFPELMLVSVVALLVIGPDKLPEAIRTASLWIGRFRRSFASIKAEIESEIGADEIRQQLHNESIMKELRDAKTDVDVALNETRQGIASLQTLPPTSEDEQPDESNDANESHDVRPASSPAIPAAVNAAAASPSSTDQPRDPPVDKADHGA